MANVTMYDYVLYDKTTQQVIDKVIMTHATAKERNEQEQHGVWLLLKTLVDYVDYHVPPTRKRV
jgi:hypothetical protein